jgi:hypothetical protein
MATETTGNSNGFLYFIVGVLLVGVVVLGFMFYNGGGGTGDRSADSTIERTADAVGDAADEVGDAARDTTPGG